MGLPLLSTLRRCHHGTTAEHMTSKTRSVAAFARNARSCAVQTVLRPAGTRARTAGRRALWRGFVGHAGCASPGPRCGGWTRGHGLPGIGKYSWPVFSPESPSVRELAVQALSSVEGGYDLLAPKFDHMPFRTPDGVLDATAAALGPLGPFGRGLDVCCGTGAGLRVLTSLCPGPVTGVDFSTGMLARVRRAHRDATWVRADVRALPFAGRSAWRSVSGRSGISCPRSGPRCSPGCTARCGRAGCSPSRSVRCCPSPQAGTGRIRFTVTTLPLTALGRREDGSPKARLVLARTGSTP
jgi:hypothetical protein